MNIIDLSKVEGKTFEEMTTEEVLQSLADVSKIIEKFNNDMRKYLNDTIDNLKFEFDENTIRLLTGCYYITKQ